MCDESRMHRVGRGKRKRSNQILTYRHKYGTSLAYRDIYPSHLGRLDMNVCSSSDPGLTGYLTCNCQVDEQGYFDGKDSEPDCYDTVIDRRLEKMADPKYLKKRQEIMQMEADRGDDGFIQLKRRISPMQMNRMFEQDPDKYGLYAVGNELYLIPKHNKIDNKGFMELELLPGASLDPKVKSDRDKDGFIVLQYTRDNLTFK